mmetsp:Transcript_33374/g.89318  ORF Transcript_33374/g.89318 Transcript_33374/m.89318 type:complete len:483 (+) Transcript_33374:3-1451(+)
MKLYPVAILGALAGQLCLVGMMSRRMSSPDEITSICEIAIMYTDTMSTFPLASADNVNAFLDVCRVQFKTFSEAVKKELRTTLRLGDYPKLLSFPRRQEPMIEENPRQCGKAWRRKTPKEMGRDAKYLTEHNIAPLKEEWVEIKDVVNVWKQGGVARIDATKILPQRMFNMTLAELAEGEPDAEDILIYQGGGYGLSKTCHKWLMYFARQFPNWGPRSAGVTLAQHVIIPLLLRFYCPRAGDKGITTLAEVGRVKDLHTDDVPWRAVNDAAHGLDDMLAKIESRGERAIPSSNLNSRRAHRLMEGVNIGKVLGIEPLVENSHSLLWWGITPGGFHNDMQDNVLLQLTGSAEVIVIPPNCSIGVDKIGKHMKLVDFIKKRKMATGFKEHIPFFHVTLTAGQGLVIPSLAIHKVIGTNSARFAINAFFEPKWGQMQWPGAANNYYKRHNKRILAIRSLWLRTLSKLYDERRLGMVMHTEKIEFV